MAPASKVAFPIPLQSSHLPGRRPSPCTAEKAGARAKCVDSSPPRVRVPSAALLQNAPAPFSRDSPHPFCELSSHCVYCLPALGSYIASIVFYPLLWRRPERNTRERTYCNPRRVFSYRLVLSAPATRLSPGTHSQTAPQLQLSPPARHHRVQCLTPLRSKPASVRHRESDAQHHSAGFFRRPRRLRRLPAHLPRPSSAPTPASALLRTVNTTGIPCLHSTAQAAAVPHMIPSPFHMSILSAVPPRSLTAPHPRTAAPRASFPSPAPAMTLRGWNGTEMRIPCFHRYTPSALGFNPHANKPAQRDSAREAAHTLLRDSKSHSIPCNWNAGLRSPVCTVLPPGFGTSTLRKRRRARGRAAGCLTISYTS
ncbi:hypothetical protein C8R45DRAFT_321302 [Mycena sanguinolenta]|nr:hypothetical protein C8R45DRAFT_321302 [Mycena sanguinolenta]